MTGAGRLVRLVLRRDRVLLPLWVILLGVLPAGYLAAFDGLFPTEAERLDYARVGAANAGFVALYGPLHGSSLDELVVWRSGFLPVLIGLFALLTVIRHTRADEEAGRTELIGATVVGRSAQLGAALIATVGASVALGAITAAVMTGQGAPASGSVWFGVELGLSGIVFAGVGAVAAQLTSSARSARAIGILVLTVAWVLRLAGDVSAIGDGALSWLAWLSPLGWVQRISPYGVNNPWPALLAVLFAVAAIATGVALRGRRDVGAGLLPPRLGPATAAPALRSPIALAWRMHRGLLAAWVAGFAALGAVFGGVGQSVADMGSNERMSEIFQRMGGATELAEAYLASTASIVGILAACYAVQATLRLRDEETAGHAEALLSTPVSRVGWVASHLLFSLLGAAAVLAAEGAAAGLVYGAIAGDVGGQLPAVLGATMAQLPAVWVLAAVAALLFGAVPRLAPVAWGAVATCLLIAMVGGTVDLSQWVRDLSPFTHIPHLPGSPLTWTPLLTLTLISAAVLTAAMAAFRHRNLPA